MKSYPYIAVSFSTLERQISVFLFLFPLSRFACVNVAPPPLVRKLVNIFKGAIHHCIGFLQSLIPFLLCKNFQESKTQLLNTNKTM